jgi:catechol 2,3-dioxygenase-like lactoylglutathione lyase family enzyme
MFAYATLGSTDFAASRQFYEAAFATLGIGLLHDYSDGGWVAYGSLADKDNPATPCLWLCKTPFNGAPATAANGAMLSLAAPNRAAVDAFYAAALANGGSSEGAPGVREAYGPDMYLAYVRDPMGNKLSIVTRAK